jgi:uncharacterized protein (TIGR02453 family)
MQFNGFSKKGIEFLTDLKNNNTKIWFESNRDIWENEINQYTKDYVEEMGETLQILVPTIKFKPKVGGSLFKIYRDVRFSKDKTPMKSKIGTIFWQGNGHKMQSSCFYMHFDIDTYFVASGIRNFKQPMLKTFREYLQNEKHRESLHYIIENIKSKGYNIPEPKFKRVPRGCDINDTYSYLYFYGAMYAFIEFDIDNTFYTFDIVTKIFNIYNDMQDIQKWVYEMSLTHNHIE